MNMGWAEVCAYYFNGAEEGVGTWGMLWLRVKWTNAKQETGLRLKNDNNLLSLCFCFTPQLELHDAPLHKNNDCA